MVRQTSIKAYYEIKNKGLLSKQRWLVYDILFQHGPLTGNELHHKSPLITLTGYRQNVVARLGELRDLGVVQEIGTRKCSITGMEVIFWDVTDKTPSKPVKKESRLSKKIKDAVEKERQACADIADRWGCPLARDQIMAREITEDL